MQPHRYMSGDLPSFIGYDALPGPPALQANRMQPAWTACKAMHHSRRHGELPFLSCKECLSSRSLAGSICQRECLLYERKLVCIHLQEKKQTRPKCDA